LISRLRISSYWAVLNFLLIFQVYYFPDEFPDKLLGGPYLKFFFAFFALIAVDL